MYSQGVFIIIFFCAPFVELRGLSSTGRAENAYLSLQVLYPLCVSSFLLGSQFVLLQPLPCLHMQHKGFLFFFFHFNWVAQEKAFVILQHILSVKEQWSLMRHICIHVLTAVSNRQQNNKILPNKRLSTTSPTHQRSSDCLHATAASGTAPTFTVSLGRSYQNSLSA